MEFLSEVVASGSRVPRQATEGFLFVSSKGQPCSRGLWQAAKDSSK
ncbi:hypothetical protein Tco_0567728, partial [Tanacetum coccineum]